MPGDPAARHSELEILEPLIAASFGAYAAARWAGAPLGDQLAELVATTGSDVLHHLPPRAGACVMMSVVYAARLRLQRLQPYVVAGDLFAGGTRIWGEDGDLDGRARFSKSAIAWDGHAWLVIGDRLADASIFRTAYSTASPPALKAHVERHIGTGLGLLVYRLSDVHELGLRYVPKYVLTDDQVDDLLPGAMKLFTGADA